MRERERERERERDIDRDGSDVTIVALKLAKNSHFPLPKIRNGTYSRYGFIVGEFPSPVLTAGRTDRPSVRPCIVSGRVGEEERLSSGEKTRIKAFLT